MPRDFLPAKSDVVFKLLFGDDYDTVKQVIGIVITDFSLIEGRTKYRHRFTLYDKSDDTEFTNLRNCKLIS